MTETPQNSSANTPNPNGQPWDTTPQASTPQESTSHETSMNPASAWDSTAPGASTQNAAWSSDATPPAGSTQDPYAAAATGGSPTDYTSGYGAPSGDYSTQPGTGPYSTANYGYQSPMNNPYASGPVRPPLASWGKRAQGWLLDWLVPSIIINLVLQAVVPSLRPSSPNYDPQASWPSWVSFLVIAAILAFTNKNGQTAGRRWAKTRLVDENGQPVQAGTPSLAHYLLHVLDTICFLGWLWPLWDQKRQTFADKVAKTYVVDESANPQQML